MPALLQGTVWEAESESWGVFSYAVGGISRRAGFGTGHSVAGGRFLVAAKVFGLRVGRRNTGSFNAVANATTVCNRDPWSRVSVGAENLATGRTNRGKKNFHRCHYAGSQCSAEEHRASRHGRK